MSADRAHLSNASLNLRRHRLWAVKDCLKNIIPCGFLAVLVYIETSLAVKVLLLQGSGLSASAGEEGNGHKKSLTTFPIQSQTSDISQAENASAGREGPWLKLKL